MKFSPVKQASPFSAEHGGHLFLITSERGNTIALFNRVLDPVRSDSAWHFATTPSHKQREGNPKPVNNPCFCFTTDPWASGGEPQSSLECNLITGSVGQRASGDGRGTGPIELHYGIMWRVCFQTGHFGKKSTLGLIIHCFYNHPSKQWGQGRTFDQYHGFKQDSWTLCNPVNKIPQFWVLTAQTWRTTLQLSNQNKKNKWTSTTVELCDTLYLLKMFLLDRCSKGQTPRNKQL